MIRPRFLLNNNDVVSAYKLPKETEEDRRNRNRAIQEGLKNAALVPLSVANTGEKALSAPHVVSNHFCVSYS